MIGEVLVLLVCNVKVMIDPMSPTPLYRQLADELAGRIERGDLRPGQMVPSEKTLEQEYGISRLTIRRAIKVLRDDGLVVTLHGRGTFVLER